MSNFDWLDLDAKLLRLLVTVVDTGSITGAAQRLGVTQSAVSHLLDKLRGITNVHDSNVAAVRAMLPYSG